MKIPKTATIKGRSSSITNAFIQAILPTRQWSTAEESEALTILGMERPNLSCAYCGDRTSEWDHLFPMVRGKKPSGYIHEIRNLVPACGQCNHSKSGADWDKWFKSKTSNSPTKRCVPDAEARFARLERFVEWGALEPISLDDLVGQEILGGFWKLHDQLQADMAHAQREAARLKAFVQFKLDHGRDAILEASE